MGSKHDNLTFKVAQHYMNKGLQTEVFKDRIRWGTILMGRATKEITKTDFYYIKKILEN